MSIVKKIDRVAKIIGQQTDLEKIDHNKSLFAVIKDETIIIKNVCDSANEKIHKGLLFVSTYPEAALAISRNEKWPVWLYDRVADIKDMILPNPCSQLVLLAISAYDVDAGTELVRKWRVQTGQMVMAVLSDEGGIIRDWAPDYKYIA